MGCRIGLVTGNPHKLEEARGVLAGSPVELYLLKARKLEIQSDSLDEIALVAARAAYSSTLAPLAVDDSGLFIEALDGFPGPYSSYVYKKLGVHGILRLLGDSPNRRACFHTSLALIYPPLEVILRGRVCGTITREPRGSRGFGFDPIFVPDGHTKTFAEMTLQEKNRVSHRARAFKALAEFARERLACGGTA